MLRITAMMLPVPEVASFLEIARNHTRESTEKWAGLWKTVMEAVFSSSAFRDFSDAAAITVCERNVRGRGGT